MFSNASNDFLAEEFMLALNNTKKYDPVPFNLKKITGI